MTTLPNRLESMSNALGGETMCGDSVWNKQRITMISQNSAASFAAVIGSEGTPARHVKVTYTF